MDRPALHTVRIHVDPIFHEAIAGLPWHVPIAEWESRGVRTLDIKRGISRHVVIFVRAGRFAFGIKEIGEPIARKEVRNYEELLLLGIHTLVPVGHVVREELPIPVLTPVGVQYERNHVAHTVTLLVDKVIPDSELFRRGFSIENRRRIWDTIAALFAELHSKGVYWGDASLANTLIKFDTVDVPLTGKKTVLTAYLADAETVEIRNEVSPALREAEISFFFESMQWINEDLRASGIIRDNVVNDEAQAHLRRRYRQLMAVERRKKEFSARTGFNIDAMLGPVPDPSYVDLFLKHIEEHKWYLSERAGKQLSLRKATRDWYHNVFVPLCEAFRSGGILDHFAGKTAAELYIEIMTNKYYLSQQRGTDVGMVEAMHDYAEKFGVQSASDPLIRRLTGRMLSIFGLGVGSPWKA